MKIILFVAPTLIAALLATTINAQRPPVSSDEDEELHPKPRGNQSLDTAGLKPLLKPGIFLQQGRYSHSTNRGDVYIMPYDNMPCLVPAMSKLAQMPGAQNKELPRNRMPNVTPPYKIPRKQ